MKIDKSFLLLYKVPILLVSTSLLFYYVFAYDLLRTDSIKLIALYTGLFFLFYKLVQITKHDIKFLTWSAFILRAIFLLAIPILSQDFYRFIWDGRVILEGLNPYVHTVESLISEGKIPVSQALELYEGMGDLSSGHYSNYPPLNQLCFVIAGLLAGKSILGSVIVLRMLIIAADFGTLYFGKKLLKKLHIPAYHIFWYILNPFTIIELTGNLHFEGVMVFFLVWSLYLLYLGKWPRAAVVFALSVSVKLIPLIFLPLFFQWFVRNTNLNNKSNERVRDDKEISIQLRLSNLFGFYGIIGVITLILFLPFYHPSLIDNYSQTIGLWFQNFEFNASFYYIAREIGYIFRGYNEIAIIGSYIPWVVLIFVLGITLLRKNIPFIKLMSGMLLALSFYYFTSTTIHPWYLVTLLALSVFTKYKFPLAWSFVIIFSYLAYVNTDNIENLWVIGLEYLVVYAVLVMDLIVLSKKPHTKGH